MYENTNNPYFFWDGRTYTPLVPWYNCFRVPSSRSHTGPAGGGPVAGGDVTRHSGGGVGGPKVAHLGERHACGENTHTVQMGFKPITFVIKFEAGFEIAEKNTLFDCLCDVIFLTLFLSRENEQWPKTKNYVVPLQPRITHTCIQWIDQQQQKRY